MVVRLPTQLVDRIDRLRGEVPRAAYLEALVVGQDASVPAAPRHGSPSPSLERFR